MRLLRSLPLFVLVVSLSLSPARANNAADSTTRVSVSSSGEEGTGPSPTCCQVAISDDGRYVAFGSLATNLVPGDTNDCGYDIGHTIPTLPSCPDVFVHDRSTGTTTRVSVSSSGDQGDYSSGNPSISGDGRIVAFDSGATNLVHDDTNRHTDVFVHDRATGITTRVSVSSNGEQGNESSWNAAISGNGRYVAFQSAASNFVDGDNYYSGDIFVHDLSTGDTSRVSMPVPGIGCGPCSYPSISWDGRYVAFMGELRNVPEDTNNDDDIYVYDRTTESMTVATRSTSGEQANSHAHSPAISADGRFVAFYSYATNLVEGDTTWSDVFVRDMVARTTTRVSVSSTGEPANSESWEAEISDDGRYVAFTSWATNLVPGDSESCDDYYGSDPCANVYVHDVVAGTTTRVSTSTDGSEGNRSSDRGALSDDGRFVAFASAAYNLAPRDSGKFTDVFVHDRHPIPGTAVAPSGASPGGTVVSASPNTSPVKISTIYFDPPGPDQNSKRRLNQERVVICNSGPVTRSVAKWKLSDRDGHVYRLSSVSLPAGRCLVVHTGRGVNSGRDLYWDSDQYVWDNTGDRATLRNRQGQVVDRCRYGKSANSPKHCS